MTSKIKVDNINKVSDDSNIIKKCGSTITLGASGDSIALASGASQTGFGRTGTVDWQTGSIKTATFTAANGEGYFANTSGGAFTMNLPAGTAGNIVSVVDYTNTFQTNNLTITPNGSQKIGGVAANFTASTEGQSVTFVYVDDTEGWKNVQDSTSNAIGTTFLTATGGTITTVCTNYKVHTFTGPGTFTVCSVGNTPTGNKVDYLVIGGAGSGGVGNGGGGGGGAGGYRESKCASVSGCWTATPKATSTSLTVTAAGFPITVGAGGAGRPSTPGADHPTAHGLDGSVSTFSTITSAGGGGGGGIVGSPGPSRDGRAGGSGGGAAKVNSNGGAGNSPPVSPPQGNVGGNQTQPSSGNVGGGGGGAGDQGETVTWSQNRGGNGGIGLTNTITGSPVGRAGGGGSNGETGCKIGGTGGFHSTGGTPSPEPGPSSPRTPGFGAGNGSNGDTTPCQSGAGAAGSGTANTGSGGGGTDAPASVNTGAGGSGIVVIRYKFQ